MNDAVWIEWSRCLLFDGESEVVLLLVVYLRDPIGYVVDARIDLCLDLEAVFEQFLWQSHRV